MGEGGRRSNLLNGGHPHPLSAEPATPWVCDRSTSVTGPRPSSRAASLERFSVFRLSVNGPGRVEWRPRTRPSSGCARTLLSYTAAVGSPIRRGGPHEHSKHRRCGADRRRPAPPVPGHPAAHLTGGDVGREPTTGAFWRDTPACRDQNAPVVASRRRLSADRPRPRPRSQVRTARPLSSRQFAASRALHARGRRQ